ncbi:response regulator transcription factor [Paenibacillus marinisediminis]
MHNLLIVEDDTALNNGICFALRQQDMTLHQAYTMEQAKELLTKQEMDLVLLDVNLPDGSGLELCQDIRKRSAVPIIFSTANDMEIDIVTGLELGGDDYITKPFSLMVLRARVMAMLRRGGQSIETVSRKIIIDEFVFDFDAMDFSKRKQPLVLSKTEQKLLKVLVSNRGHVMSRSLLVDKIWTDGAEYVDENALTVTISRLRNKLEDYPAKPRYIQTVYGLGYTWAYE